MDPPGTMSSIAAYGSVDPITVKRLCGMAKHTRLGCPVTSDREPSYKTVARWREHLATGPFGASVGLMLPTDPPEFHRSRVFRVSQLLCVAHRIVITDTHAFPSSVGATNLSPMITMASILAGRANVIRPYRRQYFAHNCCTSIVNPASRFRGNDYVARCPALWVGLYPIRYVMRHPIQFRRPVGQDPCGPDIETRAASDDVRTVKVLTYPEIDSSVSCR